MKLKYFFNFSSGTSQNEIIKNNLYLGKFMKLSLKNVENKEINNALCLIKKAVFIFS